MSDLIQVESLEKVAFKSLYRALNSCFLQADARASFRAQTVTDVRTLLDEYLVSQYSEIRHNLLKHFFNLNPDCSWNELHLFYECILDSSFTSISQPLRAAERQTESDFLLPSDVIALIQSQLEKCNFSWVTPPKAIEDFPKEDSFQVADLIKTVVSLCPNLKKFSLPKRKKLAQQAVVLAHQEPLIAKSFATLINLTKLDLCWEPKSNCTSFFSNLGSSCPSLTHFKINKLWLIGMEQALALVLGAKFDLFMESATREAIGCLHSLQFDIDCVTPICQSLKSLQVYNQRSFDYRAHAANSSVKDLIVGLFPPLLAEQIDFDEDLGDPYFWSVMAFILRHFHHLESVEIDYMMDCDPCKAILPQAVTILHQALQSTEPVKVSSFASLKWTTNSHPARKAY